MQARDIGIVRGLQTPDTALVGIDFRVQDGQLYGVGQGGLIYTIDTNTAMATLILSLNVSLAGDFFGVDFNPAANALRIISNTGQNLPQPLAGPLAGMTQTDATLNYVGPPADELRQLASPVPRIRTMISTRTRARPCSTSTRC